MQLSHDQARFLTHYTLADHAREAATTRSVIAAVPAGQEAYTPDAKSMPALKLAWHIATAELFFLNGIIEGAFKGPEEGGAEEPKDAAGVVAWYDANVPAAMEKVKALPDEALASEIDFFGMFKLQACNFLVLNVKHSVHHRGQLSAYLRPMGAKVPGIYGPSGDSK